jgi:uncharacterized damage-inducible protein DinB
MAVNATDELSARVSRSIQAEFEAVRDKVRRLVQDLSNDQLWQRPYPYGNSVGHLLLHLTGNLRYYIGAQIAGTGYVRDRPREFSDLSQPAKDEVLRAFDDALSMVVNTLARQTAEDWHRPYEAVGSPQKDRLGIFIRCAAHADHHAGQMIYLREQIVLGASGTPARA